LGTAYTPGLTVSADQIIRKVRRLPLKGEVLVAVGQEVEPQTVVARAEIPGILQSVKVAEKLGVEPSEVPHLLKVKLGEKVTKGQLLAESKGFFGLFKGYVYSEFEGTVESLSERTGHLFIREPATPVEVHAYVKGKVVEVLEGEGAVIETRGALIQGIFGIGGERQGTIRVAVSSPQDILTPEHIQESDKGAVLIGGAGVSYEALKRAEEVGAVGVVAGAVKDVDVARYLGYDIGVAITGQENIPLTLIVTEGFGILPMAKQTFMLLQSHNGMQASLNGATQIRAGVIRPEIIIPKPAPPQQDAPSSSDGRLTVGTFIRIIREPYFGQLAKVVDLPPELQKVDSGSYVRVLKAELETGEVVVVPRANVEIITT
jgi:hypothetical protein